MRRGSALLSSYSSWIHTDPELQPEPRRGPCPLRALGGAWTVMSVACKLDLLSGANQLCCDKPLLVELPTTLFKQPKIRVMISFFFSPPPSYLLSGLVHRSLTRCCTVFKSAWKGAPVWLCCIKSFFNVFQHFTTSQLDQNHFNYFRVPNEAPLHYQMLLC